MGKYTVVQHSGYVGSGDTQFIKGLESAALTDRQAVKVEAVGGVVFDSYTAAEEYADKEMYPPDVDGLIPDAPGRFSTLVKIDGRPAYLPRRREDLGAGLPDTSKPWCFYIPEDAGTPNGFIPAMVVEGESGYWPMIGNGDHSSPWYWGDTYEKACQVAEKANADRGISPEQARLIVASSIGASIRELAAQQAAQERYDNLRGRS